MKECINCKTLLEDDELFCHECGTKQEIEEPEAQVGDTQKPEAKKCIHCGESIEADSMFCPFCGKPQEIEEGKEEKPQPIPEEPEPRPTETEEVETKQQEPVAPPQPEQPQQEPVKPEQAQTNEQGSVPPPQPKSSEQSEQPKQPEQPEQPEAGEQPTYEWEEEKKSKTWLWILLALLIVGGIGVWYYMSDDFSYNDNQELTEALDTDSIEEPDEYMDYDEIAPTSELEFLKLFYKGDLNEDEHIRQNVTNDLIGKLMADYDYDCPTNDCLAYWVFAAYPAGADMELEEGPYITETDIAGKYKVDFKYSFYDGDQKEYETRTVYLTVTKMNEKYLISDYEVDNSSVESTISSAEEDHSLDGKITMIGKVSKYGIHMVLAINGANVIGYYYYDSQGDGNRVTLKGTLIGENLKLNKYDKEGNETGYFEGAFDGTSYWGENVNYNRDEALPFSVEIAN